MKQKFFQAIGRRKRSSANVRLYVGKGSVNINGREIITIDAEMIAPLKLLGLENKYNINAVVSGGGFMSTKGAIRLGIARALIKIDEAFKPTLRKAGFLTRDTREKERKKPGLKRARRAPQWQKR